MNSGPVVGEDTVELDIDLGQADDDVVEEVGRSLGGLVADEEPANGPAGGGVDGSELPDGADPLQLADVEGVQGHQIPWSGGEVAEPEGPLLGLLGEQSALRCGDLGERSHPLAPSAELVAPEDLLHPRPRQHDAPFLEGLEQTPGPEGRSGKGFGQHDLDDLGRCGVGHGGRAAALGHERRQPVAGGSVAPAVEGGAADPEGATGLGDRGLPGVVQHADSPVVDDLVKGHGGGLQFCGRNQRVHHRDPLNGGPVPPQPVNRKG